MGVRRRGMFPNFSAQEWVEYWRLIKGLFTMETGWNIAEVDAWLLKQNVENLGAVVSTGREELDRIGEVWCVIVSPSIHSHRIG